MTHFALRSHVPRRVVPCVLQGPTLSTCVSLQCVLRAPVHPHPALWAGNQSRPVAARRESVQSPGHVLLLFGDGTLHQGAGLTDRIPQGKCPCRQPPIAVGTPSRSGAGRGLVKLSNLSPKPKCDPEAYRTFLKWKPHNMSIPHAWRVISLSVCYWCLLEGFEIALLVGEFSTSVKVILLWHWYASYRFEFSHSVSFFWKTPICRPGSQPKFIFTIKWMVFL